MSELVSERSEIGERTATLTREKTQADSEVELVFEGCAIETFEWLSEDLRDPKIEKVLEDAEAANDRLE